MWEYLKVLFSGMFSKSLTKTMIDSRLGKLTCNYAKKDEFFFWNTDFNSAKSIIAISLDGDLNGPFTESIDTCMALLDNLEGIASIVQSELLNMLTNI